MTINQQEISQLEQYINNKLTAYKTEFIMTMHFSVDRINDVRNNPPITVEELKIIFDSLIYNHITAIVALNNKDTFNIRCTNTHINMPCAVIKKPQNNGSILHKNIVITIMRKKTFYSKDTIEFNV